MKLSEKHEKPITIAVTDDHFLFRKGLIALLDEYAELEVTLEASDGLELLDNLKGLKLKRKFPQVVLLDIEMPGMDGIATTVELRKKFPAVKIIILTMHDEEEMIVHMIERGAHGFLPKNEDISQVVEAIHSVCDIGYYFNDRVSKAMVKGLVNSSQIEPRFYSAKLTENELTVIRYICKEFTNKEIAEKMSLSPRTVEGFRNSALSKIGARNTAGLVMYAVKNNIVH